MVGFGNRVDDHQQYIVDGAHNLVAINPDPVVFTTVEE